MVTNAKNTIKAMTAAEIETNANSIKRNVPKYRDMVQATTIGAIAHIVEHGNVTVIIPLADAVHSAMPQLFSKWVNYVEAHSAARFNAEGLKGLALSGRLADALTKNKNGAWVGGMATLWSRATDVDRAAQQGLLARAIGDKPIGRKVPGKVQDVRPNVFHTFSKPKPEGNQPVDVEGMIARFFKTVQAAIENDTAINKAGERMSFHAIKVAIDKGNDALKMGTAKTSEPQTIDGIAREVKPDAKPEAAAKRTTAKRKAA